MRRMPALLSDGNRAVRDFYGVRGIPTLALFVEGKEVARVTGTRSRGTLSRFIDSHLNRKSETGAPAGGSLVLAAFGGDAARKAECERRLRQHIGSATVMAGFTMWNGKEGSALGCATESNDPEECARTLGTPASMVPFVDSLSTHFVAGAEFVLKWLEALSPGADTSDLPRGMCLFMLQSDRLAGTVRDDQRLRQTLDSVIEAHSAAIAEADWAPIRQALSEHRARAEGLRKALLGCLQSATWMARDDDALRGTLLQFCRVARLEASSRIGLLQDEERSMARLLNETAKHLVAQDRSPREAPQVLEREMPERWQRFHQATRYVDEAMREVGQQVAQRLMECTLALKGAP